MFRAVVISALLSFPCQAQDFFTLKGHGGPVMDIAVSESGQIATASFDNSVGLWQGATPVWKEAHRAAVNALVFVSETTLVSAGDDFSLMRWGLDDGSSERMEGHRGKVVGLAATAAGLTASASWDGTIGLWGDGVEFLQGHAAGVNDVAFSTDGALLYSASVDGTIRIWDVNQRAERQVLVKHGFGINELILNEAGGWLAYGAVDGVTRVIDLETGRAIKDLSLGRRPILAMAHDGKNQLAIGDGEGYIMVIDTSDWSIARDFRATARGPVWALAFSRNGENIHAGGLDDVMYSWPVATMDRHGQMTTAKRSFLEDPATLENGERQFKRKCSICHTLSEGSARRAGPSLYALFGRRAGTVPDYAYSPILTGSQIIWSDETIDGLFDEGPDHYIPGTKMPMQRIAKAQDRRDLIDYLKTATKGD